MRKGHYTVLYRTVNLKDQLKGSTYQIIADVSLENNWNIEALNLKMFYHYSDFEMLFGSISYCLNIEIEE